MSDEQVKKGRGCFFYGCLTLVVIVLLGIVGLVLGVRYALNKAVQQYTETQPMVIPKVQASSLEVTNLQERVKVFKGALSAGTAVEPLVLNEREINVLITGTPDTLPLKNHVYIAVQGDQLKGQVSVPLEKLKDWSMFRGRYLNGAASIKASLENGVLIVTLQSLQVKGVELPPHILTQLKSQNLAKDLYNDPNVAEFMRKLDRLEVKDGRVTVTAKAGK